MAARGGRSAGHRKLAVEETCAPPTILVVLGPMADLGESRGLPQLTGALGRVLQALFDLDPVVGVDELSQDDGIFEGRIERLVAPATLIVDVLPDDPPLLLVEYDAAKDFVRVREAVENKPVLCKG